MNKHLFVNNAASQLSGMLPQGGATLVCTTGQGSRFPTPTDGDFFYLTLYTKDVYTVEQNVEVIKVTSRVGDVMTVVRDIENITGQAGGFAYNGSVDTVYIEMRWTAGCVDNLVQTSDSRLTDARVPVSHSHSKAEVGLNNVDNTPDTDKPVSTAQALADTAVLTAAATDATNKANARQAPIGTIVGLVKGNGANALTAAVAGTDFVAPVGSDAIVTRQMLKDCGLSYYDSTTTNALDFPNGSHQRWAPNTGAQTLTVTNWPPTGNLGELLIEGVNLGAATITWPTINWVKADGTFTTTFSANGVTLQTAGTDFVLLWTRNGGTTIYGKIIR